MKSKLRDRAIRYSGFFGVREKWVRPLEISWSFLFSLKGPKFGPIDKVIFCRSVVDFLASPQKIQVFPQGVQEKYCERMVGVSNGTPKTII